MHVAGYEFHVLNNAFTNHWGFQTVKARPSWRAKQSEENHALFKNFSREIVAKYGRDPFRVQNRHKRIRQQRLA